MVSPVSAPAISLSQDGPAFDAPSSGGYGTIPSLDAYNITGPLTMAVRANVRASGGVIITKAPSGGGGSADTPFWFGTNANSLFSLRSNSGYVLWQSNSASLGPGTLKTHAVSSADIGTAPTFYYDGVADGAFVLFTSGGTGATNTNTNPVYVGQGANVGNQLDGQINIALVSAMLWPDALHQRFHFEPYAILEEAPRYYFATPSGGAVNTTIAIDALAYTYAAQSVGLSSARTMSVEPLAYRYAPQDVGLSYRQAAHTLDVQPLAYGYRPASVDLTFSGAVQPVGATSRTRRGARRVYLPETQATAVFHPDALPEELAAHAVKAWQDDEGDEWFLLA